MITYNEVFQLNALLGKLKIKSLDHATFINVIEKKCDINKAVKDHSAIAEEIQREYQIQPGLNGSIEFKPEEKEKATNFFKAFEELGKREVKLPDLKILSSESFSLLHKENDLNVDELVLIKEYLVK